LIHDSSVKNWLSQFLERWLAQSQNIMLKRA
jgi:hypothetical protein